MKTKGEIEADISRTIVQFEIDYMGRGPKETQVHIVEDLVVVRLKGVSTPAEEQLTQSSDGKDLVKKCARLCWKKHLAIVSSGWRYHGHENS